MTVPHPALVRVARWTAGRKETVLVALRGGEVTLGQVYSAHGLSPDELASWHDRQRRHGRKGLSSTRQQIFR